MSIWWSLHLRREAGESVPLARRLLGTMETAGVDPDISFDLSLALSEACANAVEHGGDRTALGETAGVLRVRTPCRGLRAVPGHGLSGRREMPYRGQRLGAGLSRRRALRPAAPSEQQHTRPALPARDAEAESGRGLDLIQQLSDHVQFGNRPGHGAVVRFDKVLKWREGALLTV